MADRDPWGVLTEGVVQTFPARGAAVRFQREHAIFWGRKSPLMTLVGDHWVFADDPSRPSAVGGVSTGEVE